MTIIRVYRCTVIAGQEDAFHQYAFSTSHPRIRERPGLTAFYAGRSLPDSGGRERCMVQLWESPEALQAALGPAWREPPVLPPEAQVLIEAQSVEHYELRDTFHAAP